MGQTTKQIEAAIQDTRDSLGSNLDELEQRARSAADWKEQFRGKPGMYLSVAFGGGLILAALFGGKKGNNGSREVYDRTVPAPEPVPKAGRMNLATSKLWDGVRVALVGAATTRLMHYLNPERPGSDERSDRTNGTAW